MSISVLNSCRIASFKTIKHIMDSLLHRIASGSWPVLNLEKNIFIYYRNVLLVGPQDSIIDICLLDEPRTASLIFKIINNGLVETFVDIGAYIGSYSIPIASMGVKVTAIEPNPYIAAYLKINSIINKVNIHIYEEALCPPGMNSATLCIPRLHTGAAYVDKNGGSNNCYLSIQVPCLNQDNIKNIVSNVDFIKIDVEGLEDIILNNVIDLINSTYIVIEVRLKNIKYIKTLLKEKEYKCYIVEKLLGSREIYNLFCEK